MGGLLGSPWLWIALGACMFVALLLGGDGNSKKRAARLQRVSQRRSAQSTEASASLRRAKPGEHTPLGQALYSMQSITKLRGRLENAGLQHTTPQKFLGIMAGIAVVVTLLMLIVAKKPLLLSLLFGLLVGLAIPHLVVGRKIRKRQLAFLKLFPDAIELMVRGLRAGLPVAESFITVSKELPPPMGDTFATIAQQTQLGMPMEKALAESAEKLGITEFNFFVTTIILQRETGGNLGEILSNLADMLRQRHMMKLKVGALSSEARASAYIIGSLPFFVFVVLWIVAPDYLGPLFNDPRGHKALLAAAFSLGTGAFIMKRMTALEV
jgi:tight adherence protein B